MFHLLFLPLQSQNKIINLKKVGDFIMKFECVVDFMLMFNTETRNDSREYPKSVYDKMSKLHLHHKKVTCQVMYSTYALFTIEAPTKECALTMLGNEFGKMCKKENLSAFNVNYKVEEATIMNCFNAHDPKLVEKINYLWARTSKSFKPILFALYERDKEEAEEKEIVEPNDENFESFAYDFMMHVCDDADLEVIINFIRYRNKNGVQLFTDTDIEHWVV